VIRSGGKDHGSASIWTLSAATLVLAIGMTATLAGVATIARHQAQTAADFGALAGASMAELQPQGACAAAEHIVEANHAVMRGCSVDGFDVTVTAVVDVAGAPAGVGPAVAVARAGPVGGPL